MLELRWKSTSRKSELAQQNLEVKKLLTDKNFLYIKNSKQDEDIQIQSLEERKRFLQEKRDISRQIVAPGNF